VEGITPQTANTGNTIQLVKEPVVRISLVLILVVLLAGAAFAADPVNLVPNGDFEKTGTPLPGWKFGSREGGASLIDAAVKKDGAGSLKLYADKKGNAAATSEYFAVKPDTYYLVSFYLHAEGFGDKGWVGADASARLYFADEKNVMINPSSGSLPNVGYPWVLGFPYANIPDWQQGITLMKSPSNAVKAAFQVAVNNAKDELSPAIWLDNINIREFTVEDAKGKALVFNMKSTPRLSAYNSEAVENAAVATKDKQKAGTLVSGPYVKTFPCGLYAVTFRLKTADNTLATPLLQIGVDRDGLGGRVANLRLKGTDFKAADTFQDFTIPAFKTPTGWIAFPVYWSGEATVTLDSVTITEVKTMTPEEWTKFAQ
jgi:hypothetical protein